MGIRDHTSSAAAQAFSAAAGTRVESAACPALPAAALPARAGELSTQLSTLFLALQECWKLLHEAQLYEQCPRGLADAALPKWTEAGMGLTRFNCAGSFAAVKTQSYLFTSDAEGRENPRTGLPSTFHRLRACRNPTGCPWGEPASTSPAWPCCCGCAGELQPRSVPARKASASEHFPPDSQI